jgi:hypothetical protein
MTSAFDPATFLDATISEPSVKRPPLPAGRDFVGIIGEVKSRSWQGKQDPTKSGIAIDVPVTIDLTAYPDLGEKYAATKQVVLSDSIMLDLTESGSIDNSPGRNGKLRRYREALNMNKPGDSFSFRAMQGRQVKVRISHREYQGDVFDQIETVARAA